MLLCLYFSQVLFWHARDCMFHPKDYEALDRRGHLKGLFLWGNTNHESSLGEFNGGGGGRVRGFKSTTQDDIVGSRKIWLTDISLRSFENTHHNSLSHPHVESSQMRVCLSSSRPFPVKRLAGKGGQGSSTSNQEKNSSSSGRYTLSLIGTIYICMFFMFENTFCTDFIAILLYLLFWHKGWYGHKLGFVQLSIQESILFSFLSLV